MILSSEPVLRIVPPDATGSSTDAVMSLEDAQRRQIEKALKAAEGGRINGPGGAAELLGVKPTTLRSKIKRLGLDPRRHRDD